MAKSGPVRKSFTAIEWPSIIGSASFERLLGIFQKKTLRCDPVMPILRAVERHAGRMVGRQADTIPADISMAVQPTV